MSVSKLVLQFATMDGETITMSYNYAKPDLSLPYVKALTAGIVSNGSIFTKVPALPKSAKLITSNESQFDLDE